ncbi:hypothetical protein H5T56_02780 [Candidatus Bipolaricaulota bacterium]|nr:hypothetical protein [Candidatus Bipolaricaulota bacterium]
MRKLGLVVFLVAALGLAGPAQPTAVKLAPAEDEVKALREAWTKVLDVLEEFLVEFKGAIDTLNKNDQDLLAKYRALAVQLKDLEAKLLQFQEMYGQKIPALERSIAECANQIAALRRNLEEAIAGYKAADAELEAKFTSLFGEAVAGYKAADAELEARLTALIEELRKALDTAIADYRAADSDLAAKIAGLAVQMDQLASRVSALESYDIGNLSRRVLSLEQAIQAVQIKIENNREKIAALEKTIGGLSADISALKDSVLTLEARVSDHDLRLAELESKVGTDIQDLTGRLDMVQTFSILALLAGIGAIVLVLLGIGG